MLREEVESMLHDVCDSQYFVLGPRVAELEESIAAYVGTTRAVGCASGSDALLLALMALDVKAGDEVICPSYTFFATGGAIRRLGAFPVWADIDPVTYNVTPESIETSRDKLLTTQSDYASSPLWTIRRYGRCIRSSK